MRRVLQLAGGAVLLAAVVLLWPQRFGGSTTILFTHGASMKPAFVAGDMAVLRTAPSYHVGDIAGYRSDRYHSIVMHRIVEQTPAGFVFRGDNNSFKDPDVVPASKVVGKLALHVPKVGKAVSWLVQPLHLGLLLIGIGLLVYDKPGRKTKPTNDPAPVMVAEWPDIPDTFIKVRVSASTDLSRLGSPVLIEESTGRGLVIGQGVVYWHRPAATAHLTLVSGPGKHQAPAGWRRSA